jgi:acyl-CoA thioesterase-1
MPTPSIFRSRRAFLYQCAAFWPVTAALRAGAAEPAVPSAAAVPSAKTILFFGDSLTAGYGLEDPAGEAYPALIGAKLKTDAPAWKVVNAGLSGETTSAGLRRIDWVLRQPVDLFVLALGGNDGLRGIGAPLTKSNLKSIIGKVRQKNPKTVILLAGMKMPVSMGAYAAEFEAVFASLSSADKALVSIPFLLEGVGGVAAVNQADAIHPNAEGHRKVAEHVWKTLEPLLKTLDGKN